jgi:hypothetical protein
MLTIHSPVISSYEQSLIAEKFDNFAPLKAIYLQELAKDEFVMATIRELEL